MTARPPHESGSVVVRTFLMTDIVGSTPLWDAEPAPMAKALVAHTRVVEDVVARHNGRVVREKGEGDSAFAAFEVATDAVAAAVELQLALEQQDWPTSRPIRVRIGLHTGEAATDGDDFLGATINRCARLRALADAGQVVTSGSTAALVEGRLPSAATIALVGTVSLRGLREPERVHEVRHPSFTSEPVRLGRRTGTLPAIGTLIGRDEEVGAIGAALESSHRIVTIVGPGGVGKTTLAVAAATRARLAFEDGAWFVDARALSSTDALPHAIATVLGIQDEADPRRALAEYVSSREILLVVDNLEHLDGAGPVLEAIAIAGDHVRVIATSRSRLGVRTESVLALDPLLVSATADDGKESPAVQLFLARAAEARPGLVFGPDELAAARHVAARLDGLPLALELAAARLRALSIGDLRRRLDETLSVLDARSAPRTLRQTIDWSWQLLDGDEQTTLRRLAVFPSVFGFDAAEHVATLGGGGDVLDTIEALVDRSLLAPADRRDSAFSMLAAIREFAMDQLAAAGEEDLARRAHFGWCRQHAGAPPDEQRDLAPWLSRVEEQRHDIEAAARWAVSGGDVEAGVAFLEQLRHWLTGNVGGSEFVPILRQATAAATDHATRVLLRDTTGFVLLGTGEYDAAAREFEAAIDDDRDRLGWSWYYLGHAHYRTGDFAAAEEAYLEAGACGNANGDARLESWAANNRGLLAQERHDPATACSRYRDAVAIARRGGAAAEPQLQTAESNLTRVLHELGEVQMTVESQRELVRFAKQHVHPMLVVLELGYLARTLIGVGLADEAIDVALEAVDLGSSAVQALPNAIADLGWARRAVGDLDEAEHLFARAVDIAHTATDDRPDGDLGLIAIAADKGDVDRVRSLVAATSTPATSIMWVSMRHRLAVAELAAGNLAPAADAIVTAAAAAPTAGWPSLQAIVFDAASGIAAAVSEWEVAARLCGARLATWRWWVMPSLVPTGGEGVAERARAQLGPARFEELAALGAAESKALLGLVPGLLAPAG